MYYYPGLEFPYDPSLDDWGRLGYDSRQAMVDELVKRRTEPELPTVPDFVVEKVKKVWTLDGPAEKRFKCYKSGTPRYWVVLAHEMDSWWQYPEIRRTLISGPEHTCSHAEMVRHGRVQARRAAAAAKGKLRTGDTT